MGKPEGTKEVKKKSICALIGVSKKVVMSPFTKAKMLSPLLAFFLMTS